LALFVDVLPTCEKKVYIIVMERVKIDLVILYSI